MRLLPGFSIFVLTVCASPSHAADTLAGEQYFKSACVACHGQNALGVPGLAPPLKGSDYVKQSPAEELSKTITEGRIGPTKRLKEYAGIMPPHVLDAQVLESLIAYLRGPLQQ